jgi:hypothetical protein
MVLVDDACGRSALSAEVKPRQQKRRQRVEGEFNDNGKRRIVTGLLRRKFAGKRKARGVDSVAVAMYFQRQIPPAAQTSLAGMQEDSMLVKYIAMGSYWLGVVCALVSIVGRMCDAFGIAFVRIMTRGNMIDVRSFLDAGLLFLFIAIASANYLWFQERQRGS